MCGLTLWLDLFLGDGNKRAAVKTTGGYVSVLQSSARYLGCYGWAMAGHMDLDLHHFSRLVASPNPEFSLWKQDNRLTAFVY
jgi:hypothetical protein